MVRTAVATLEPTIHATVLRRLTRHRISQLSGWGDLNPRPLRPERSALPTCATSRFLLTYQATACRSKLAKPAALPPVSGASDDAGGRVLVVTVSGEYGVDGFANPKGIERLHQPAVCT